MSSAKLSPREILIFRGMFIPLKQMIVYNLILGLFSSRDWINFGHFFDQFLMTPLLSANPCKQDFQKVLAILGDQNNEIYK